MYEYWFGSEVSFKSCVLKVLIDGPLTVLYCNVSQILRTRDVKKQLRTPWWCCIWYFRLCPLRPPSDGCNMFVLCLQQVQYIFVSSLIKWCVCLYRRIKSCRNRRNSNVGSFSTRILSSYGLSLRFGTSFVVLRCNFSILSLSPLRCGDHTGVAYSTWGRIRDL